MRYLIILLMSLMLVGCGESNKKPVMSREYLINAFIDDCHIQVNGQIVMTSTDDLYCMVNGKPSAFIEQSPGRFIFLDLVKKQGLNIKDFE